MAKFTCGPCDSKSMRKAHLFTIFSYISIYNIKQMFFLLVNSHSIYFVLYFLKCHLHYKLLVWLHDYLYLPVPSKFIMVATKRGTYQPRQLKDQFGSKVLVPLSQELTLVGFEFEGLLNLPPSGEEWVPLDCIVLLFLI